MTDWAKRAKALFPIRYPDADSVLASMLQLGQEMADARAEEIAKAIDKSNPYATERGCLDFCAAIARSTIAKAEPEAKRIGYMAIKLPGVDREDAVFDEAAIRADEREKVKRWTSIDNQFPDAAILQNAAALIETRNVKGHEEPSRYLRACAHAIRTGTMLGPKSREAVLAEALMAIEQKNCSALESQRIASKALEYWP